MAFVTYGGPPGTSTDHPQAINIEIAHVLGYSRRPIYDGPTYLYTEYELHVRGIVNPEATSYVARVDGSYAAQKGEYPSATMRAIQHALLQPRRQLIYDQMQPGREVLISPHSKGAPGAGVYNLDSSNGPFPLYADNFQTFGTKSVILNFGIKTRISECPRVAVGAGGGSVMLSHRWTAERGLDQDFYTTLVRRGHAYFDTARLEALGAVPDDFFGALLPPPGFGFKRTSVQAVAHEDGHRVDYVVVDREVPISIISRADAYISRIEAWHSATIEREDLIRRLTAGVRGGVSGAKRGGDVVPVLGHIIGGIAGGASAMVGVNIPNQSHSFNVRVWGSRLSKRGITGGLEAYAAAIIVHRMKLVAGALDIAKFGFTTTTTHDLMGKWVQVSAHFKMGLFKLLLPEGIGVFPPMPESEDVPGILASFEADNPRPPNDRSSRGHYLGQLVARGLVAACEGPKGVVTLPPDRTYRTP